MHDSCADASALPGYLSADLDRFEQPQRGSRGRAFAVVRPSNDAEVREIVRWAISANVRLLPQGAVTGLVNASVPDASGTMLVVSSECLVGPIEIDPVERLVTVPAGTLLGDLNAAAALHNLQLPIDLAANPALGGMVATNTGGSRVLRYGPLRHHVLGLGVVTADFTASLLSVGGRFRKDSRGVDLTQCLIGSGGALGVITVVTVSLQPLPRTRSTWWLSPRANATVELFGELCAAFRTLSAFEFVSGATFTQAARADGYPSPPFAVDDLVDGAILFEVEDVPDDEVALVLQTIAARSDLFFDALVLPPEQAWEVRHAVTGSLRRVGTVVGHDVAVPRRAIASIRRETASLVAAIVPRAVLCDFGHVGDGGLHLNVLFPAEVAPPTPAERDRLRDGIDQLVAAHQGTFSAEHGLGPLNAHRWLQTTSHAEKALLRTVKTSVDHAGILGHPGHPYNLLVGATAG